MQVPSYVRLFAETDESTVPPDVNSSEDFSSLRLKSFTKSCLNFWPDIT